MTELFLRSWRLHVGNVLIDSSAHRPRHQLDVAFRVAKSTKREPNAIEISIYNLNQSHRERIASAERVGVRLEAGYAKGDLTTIYDGDLRNAKNVTEGRDIITKIEGEDAGTTYRESRINRSFAADTPVLTVLETAVRALGIGLGNLQELDTISLEDGGATYTEGATLDGPARDEVDRIVRSCGKRWSIQDGVFQLRDRRQPIRARAIRLTPGSGLIGIPARTKSEGRGPQITKAQCLILPGLYPGRIIVLESNEISGQFMLQKLTYNGSTFGNEWHADLELVEY